MSEKIKKVERWQTTDGTLFVGILEAGKHQKRTDTIEAVKALVRDQGWEGMSMDDICTMILENAGKFKEIL